MTALVSVLDLFSIGIGPSSSHTVGPMRAARDFAVDLASVGAVERVQVALCGSLGATGAGHGTPDAIVAGLRGLDPETCDTDEVPGGWEKLGDGRELMLAGGARLVVAREDIRMAPLTRLSGHSNGMRFLAYGADGSVLREQVSYSVGGGFVVTEGTPTTPQPGTGGDLPFPYASAATLLEICEREGLSIAEVAWRNECALRPEADVAAGLDRIWRVMSECVDAGLARQGVLPGRLGVRRRAFDARERLERLERTDRATGAPILDRGVEWLQAYAMAVNEENADGRRVVTAPTNGAAGILPAVGRHFLRIHPGVAGDGAARHRAMRTFLLTAGAIGDLYKRNASISGAEAGCQGRSDRLARWRPGRSPRSRAGVRGRWRMRPRSRWSTISA